MVRLIKFSVCALAATVFYVAPAHAQATRTWVSGVGDDANPCSRTAPCKTFAGAISKTATGGEINCLDPGGFGGVTIIKSMSIVCEYTEGGVLVAGAGVNGIVINATATSDVYLRGLDIFGAGNAQNGVRFIAGRSLSIEDSVIRSFNASGGFGISFQPSGTSRLTINNTTIGNNGNGGTGGGILIQPTGAGGNASVNLRNIRVQNNFNSNLLINTAGNTGTGITVVIDDSEFSGSSQGINLSTPASTSTIAVLLSNSVVANNTSNGIVTDGSNAAVRVSNTTITGNARGVNATNLSAIFSFGDNRLVANPSFGAANNGAFNGAVIPPQ